MSGLLFDTPYQSVYLYQAAQIKWEIALEPCLIFGWNYHNDGDTTIYAKLFDTDDPFVDPTANVPKVRIGMPPEQSSGNILNVGGIDFEVGCVLVLTTSIDDATYGDFGWDVEITTFVIPKSDL